MAKKFIVRGDIPKEPAMIIEGQLIICPGEYYGISLTEEEIKRHIRLTDWTDKFNTALVYGHRTNTDTQWIGNPSPDDWAGHFTQPQYLSLSDGVSVAGAYSNIYIYDEDLAKKLAYGRLKCGVSVTFDLQHGGIKNLSVVDNPKCKQAFLNLSDAGGKLESVEIVSPKYLNLSESDSPTNERGLDSKNTMTENTNKTEKEIELEKKVSELEKQIADNAKPVEPTPEPVVTPTPEPATPAPEPTKVPDAPVVEKDESVATNIPAKEEPVSTDNPVIIEEPTKVDPEGDSKVVSAIEKMTEKVTEELKRASAPQSVAPTSPDQISSRDDEVTQTLVDKYKSLHNIE